MARCIHCEQCNKEFTLNAQRFGELYESLEGTALYNMYCDGACGTDEATLIKEGDKCFAAVLLDNKAHPNYNNQKPEVWANEFMLPKQ